MAPGGKGESMTRQGSRGDRRRSLVRAAQAEASGSPVGTPSLDTAPVDAPGAGLASAGDTDAAVALRSLGQAGVMGVTTADVGAHRERVRQGKMRRLALLLVPIAAWLVVRATVLHRGPFGLPHFPSGLAPYLPGLHPHPLFLCMMIIPLLGAGRSPHILYRPNEIDVRFDDVRGAPVVVDEVVKTLNLFLAHRTFAEHMGGSARRAILFEGPPGTGKTYMAKAMAAEAGVPFLFVSSSAFQSMFYGQTNRKIRSYFRALRNYARREGGAIGFIEEIDAIGGARGGMGTGRHHDGVAGVVNELLIQLQSFDQPPRSIRIRGCDHRPRQRLASPSPATSTSRQPSRQHPRHRGDQPGRGPRPRPGAPGPIRPLDLLRPARRSRAGATSSTTTWPRRPTIPSSTTRPSATRWRR